jgi:hypothetical protein
MAPISTTANQQINLWDFANFCSRGAVLWNEESHLFWFDYQTSDAAAPASPLMSQLESLE